MNYEIDSDEEVYGPSLKEYERDDKQFDQYNMFRFQDLKTRPNFDPLSMDKPKEKGSRNNFRRSVDRT